jgi:4-hydroxy-tetrahydrodipicolinate reductase
MLRVGVLGACGRMGTAVCAAVLSDPDLELVAVVDPVQAGETIGATGLAAAASLDALAEAGAEVAVDFTVGAAVPANAAWCAAHGVHAVIGTTGFDVEPIRAAFEASSANCVVAPNFAIGAVLMMRFAELAAPWFETAEVVELHHDGKIDAPSGTALLTAKRIAAARRSARASASASPAELQPSRGLEGAPGVMIHSVRLRGLVAHQEVLFGTAGEILTLRHDSLDRGSFMPGVILAVKQVPFRPGFTVGLEALLGL